MLYEVITLREGFCDLHSGLEIGARNMIGVGIATATAGIIVGTVTLTGIGLVLTELVEAISGGNLLAMLMLVAVASLILGMGMPTTANYIIVSTLMAPVRITLYNVCYTKLLRAHDARQRFDLRVVPQAEIAGADASFGRDGGDVAEYHVFNIGRTIPQPVFPWCARNNFV